MMGRRALFLDWGGTLTRLRDNRTMLDGDGHPVLMPGVEAVLARVRGDYAASFIVSNQGRIARGEISEGEVRRRFAWANERLGRPFSDWRLCSHEDADGCACRKPRPGMFRELAAAHGIALAASTHVGDSDKDRDAAAAAGIADFRRAADFFDWR